ncbi:MAG: twin-arginine translocase subunit TatC [Prevotella sp.]|nr:twin-arginine translocase subunit TatC [Prevotella sp.]
MAENEEMTFWEHLDVFRSSIIKILVATVATGIIAFVLKDPLFRIVLAPQDSNFFLWQWVGVKPFSIQLINTGLAEQFLIHMKVALVAGLICASPYLLYVLFCFVSPALYENERRYSVRITLSAYLLFLLGVLVNYLLVFPLTVRFLGTYQVNNSVANMLTISSYVDTLLMLSLMMGVVFELPVLSWLLAKFGLLRKEWMARYRRHAFVIILIVAAVITPTADIFTLLIVSLPIWLLYECSIFVVGRVQKNK